MSILRTIVIFMFLAMFALYTDSPVFAQTEDSFEDGNFEDSTSSVEGSSISAVIGAGIGFTPEFEGSNRYDTNPFPIVDINVDRWFLSISRGLGYNIISSHNLTIAPAVRYRQGRDEDDSDLLKGLGDIDAGLEYGGVVRLASGPFEFIFKGYQGLGDIDGLTMELGAFYHSYITDQFKSTFGISTMYADEEFNRAYFGINHDQSIRSGYRVYVPDAGIKHYAFSGYLGYNLTESLEAGFFGEYKRLNGEVADSPLVERGSADQISSGLSLKYHFK